MISSRFTYVVPGAARSALVAVALLSAFLWHSAAADTVHQYRDHRGRALFTDRPMAGRGMEHVGTWTWKGWEMPRGYDASKYSHNKLRFSPAIAAAAREFGVSRALLHAVIHAESAYDPDAVSRAGAVGLMQLMPATAKRFDVSDRRDPRQNLTGGTRYLRHLLELFSGNMDLAVAAYNAGEHTVKRYGNKVPPYKETKTYLSRVKRQFEELRTEYPESLYN